MTEREVAQIAEGLSEAQRKALIRAKETVAGNWRVMPFHAGIRVSFPTLRNLNTLGLFSEFSTGTLSHLGLAVRDYLIKDMT